MSPETHLFASWIIGAKATRNLRDCRLVALAGILPDADGLGLIADMVTNLRGGWQSNLCAQYHHFESICGLQLKHGDTARQSRNQNGNLPRKDTKLTKILTAED